MENQRLIVWGAFGLLAFMTYQTWLQDETPAPVAQTTTTETAPDLAAPTSAGLPSLPSEQADTPVLLPEGAVESAVVPEASGAATITVETDVLNLRISTQGGRIIEAELKNYPVAKDQPELVTLMSSNLADYATMQSGLIGEQSDREPYFNAVLSSPRSSYDLGNDEELVVALSWDNGAGVVIEKQLRFERGSYRIDVQHTVTNNGDAPWRAAQYSTLVKRSQEMERSMFNVDTYSFDGPIIYNGDKSEKLKRDDLLEGPTELVATNGWIAGIQHHFLSAIIPPAGTEDTFKVSARNNLSTASVFGTAATVAVGGEHVFENTLFVGPKLQSQLVQIDPSLKLTVDYGFLTILSNPLFMLLSWVYSLVANWGVAIILVTVLIKMLFYKLTEKSGRSMAKMREIQPRMKALQDRYKDDKPALSQAMMELYKREKVNPAAGCLPILIQMPFFLAFYWVLLESVEMRQAPFALWITDLSSRDPYFILPIIMGAAMLFQQRLNPAPADPVQAKVMQIMPIMFTVFFAFFPAGLVLYWVTNTLLSIAQQWYVNRVVEEERKNKNRPKSDKNKGSKKA